MSLMIEINNMIDETRILDELKAIVSPFSAYLDNLYLAFTTSSDQYRRQVEEGKVNPVLTAFYGPEWGDCSWEFDSSIGIRRTLTTVFLDVGDADHLHNESITVVESFDDWVIKAIEKEKRLIYASILNLVNNSQSTHSTWTKLNYLSDEIHSIKSQFVPENSYYFTERVVARAMKILDDIDKHLIRHFPPVPGELKPKPSTTFEYQGEDIEHLLDLYDGLQRDNRFIDGQMSRPRYFVNGFCGRITDPVVWGGSNDELRHFIYIIVRHKVEGSPTPLIRIHRNSRWSAANQLFIKRDGTRFPKSLNSATHSSPNARTAIESLIARLR